MVKKIAKKKRRAKRKRSHSPKIARPYPRVLLEKAIEIPFALKEKNGGNPWSPKSIADAVKLPFKSYDFFYMAAAARDFGFTSGGRDSKEISLTKLGRELVYAPEKKEEDDIKRRTFLSIPTFKNVLEYYKGSSLPEMKYLGNTLEDKFKLDPATHTEFSDLFQKNCRYLGIGKGFGPEDKESTTSDDQDIESIAEKNQSVITLGEIKGKTGLKCFVVMPFTERDPNMSKGFFDEVLKSLILPAGMEAGFNVRTANRSGSDVIQATIVNDLLDADLIVADLTEHNPNVLFELGMRMAEDKPVALIRAKGTSPIFDVDNMLRVFEYDPNLWESTVKEDLPDLIKHIKEAWEQRESGQSYIKILRSNKSTV